MRKHLYRAAGVPGVASAGARMSQRAISSALEHSCIPPRGNRRPFSRRNIFGRHFERNFETDTADRSIDRFHFSSSCNVDKREDFNSDFTACLIFFFRRNRNIKLDWHYSGSLLPVGRNVRNEACRRSDLAVHCWYRAPACFCIFFAELCHPIHDLGKRLSYKIFELNHPSRPLSRSLAVGLT